MSDEAVEVIDGEAVEVGESKALARIAPEQQALSVFQGGIAALAVMTDEEFDRNLKAIAKIRERVDQVKKAIMRPGIDFGPPFPGSKKDTLLKPGTETLLRTFGLADTYRFERFVGTRDEEPDLEVVAHCSIHVGTADGPVIAEGVGSASTYEKKYRYEGEAGRQCPNCGVRNIIPSRRDGGGWWCGTRDGGCGTSFPANDERITSQEAGKAENEDPWDDANTIYKIAKKRALVDGVLTATGTSGVFTQDEDQSEREATARARAAGQGAAQGNGAASGATGARAGAPGASGAPTDDPLPAGVIQAVVKTAPDGIRVVTPKSEQATKYGVADRHTDKLEVVTSVGNSKHTALLFGDIARAVDVLALKVGEVVRFHNATVEKIIWQEDKPPKKEIWGVTRVEVMRDGTWVSASEAMPSLPLQDPPGREPESLPTPPAAAPAAPPAAATPPPAAGSSASADGAPIVRTDGEAVTIALRLVHSLEFGTAGTKAIGVLKGVAANTEIVKVALADEPAGELEAQLGTAEQPAYKEGDEVMVMGVWKNEWVIATAIGRKPGTLSEQPPV